MKRSALAAAVFVALAAALLVTGCGDGSNPTTPAGGGTTGGVTTSPASGGAKKATAPDAPAGSKVVSCSEGRGEAVQLRAAAVDCTTARTTMQDWERSHACALGKSASRNSCSLGGFRCQATRVDRGAAVSCARQGGDVSFIAKSWL
jgi:hypothetical protein